MIVTVDTTAAATAAATAIATSTAAVQSNRGWAQGDCRSTAAQAPASTSKA